VTVDEDDQKEKNPDLSLTRGKREKISLIHGEGRKLSDMSSRKKLARKVPGASLGRDDMRFVRKGSDKVANHRKGSAFSG